VPTFLKVLLGCLKIDHPKKNTGREKNEAPCIRKGHPIYARSLDQLEGISVFGQKGEEGTNVGGSKIALMSNPKTQSFSSHGAIDPLYHYVGAVALLANLIFAAIVLFLSIRTQMVLSLWIVSLTVLLIVLLLRSRTYPLKIQDRIIRLEERIRLEGVLPEPLRKRIPELTEDQLVGLRFAPDEELPELVAVTLEKQLTRKQIKERIQNWRADHFRI
jgi:hypothetical protein